MRSMSAAHSLSNIQQELLKLYSSNIAESDLLNIKRYLAKYFASKAIDEADNIWDQKGYDNDTMKKWLNGETSDDKGNH
jgi:hypothetical protein